MVRGYPDYSPGAARTPEGLLLPTIAMPPVWFEERFVDPCINWKIIDGTVTLRTSDYDDITSRMGYESGIELHLYNTLDNTVEIQKQIGMPPTVTNIGIEIFIAFQCDTCLANSNTDVKIIDLRLYNGARQTRATLCFNIQTKKWYVLGPDSATANYVGTHGAASEYWMRVKLIFNLNEGYYKKVFIDNDEFDASSYQLDDEGATALYFCTLNVSLKGGEELSHTTRISRVKITYGES